MRHSNLAANLLPKVLNALTPAWPVGPYRYPSDRPGWYPAMVGALCGVLILQHVASMGSGPEPSPTKEVGSATGAGGNSPPLYLEPPPVPAVPPGVKASVLAISAEAPEKQPTASLAVRGIPSTVLSAYRQATDRVDKSQPGCHLSMPLLAAIGRVESGHAQGGNVDAAGTTRTPILGPRLDGGPGIAAIRDTDGGTFDGDTVWDRAVGPMQFIPSTWRAWSSDNNGDGVGDPNNVFDATLAAGRYLCAASRDLSTSDGLRRAVLSYNHSEHYLSVVLSWMRVYAGGAVEVPNVFRGTASKDDKVASRRPDSQRPARDSAQQSASGADSSHQSPEPRSRTLSKPSPSPAPTAPPAQPPREPDDDATVEVPEPSRPELPRILPTTDVPVGPKSVPIG